MIFCTTVFASDGSARSMSRNRNTTAEELPIGVGVDAIDIFFHYLPTKGGGIQSPRNRTFANQTMHQACKQLGFTTIRAAAVGFWPADMAVWQTDQATWWKSVGNAIKDAEDAGCLLLLDVFWNTFAFPDLAGEPLPSIADTSSKSWSMMKEYATGLVRTVGNSPAVVGWEVTNELNLLMDLDMAGRKASIAPSMGTPTQRTRADNISTAVGVQFGANVASLLRSLDPLRRPVSAGYSMPRSSAWHLMQSYPTGKEDFTLDSEEEFRRVLAIIHEPFEIASAHLYARPGPDGNVRFNSTPTGPYDTSFLGIFSSAVRALGKQPLLGEFGDPLPGARPWTHAVLPALGTMGSRRSNLVLHSKELEGGGGEKEGAVPTGITTALVWCWEFYQRSPTIPANFSLIPGRDDATIQLMQETNARLRQV